MGQTFVRLLQLAHIDYHAAIYARSRRVMSSSRRPVIEPNGIGFVDLFAGCGGLALGFVLEGYEPIFAVEWEADAVETYRLNIDDRVHADDIRTVRTWPRAKVLVGGPPCQGFSALGTRNPYDRRNALWMRYLDALDETEAEVFVMENVPQLLDAGQFTRFRREVRRRGFELSADVLCAADYGVPQMRYRAIAFGSKLGKPVMPVKTHGPARSGRKRYITVRKALSTPVRLPKKPDGDNWHVDRKGVRPFSFERYRAVPPDGGNRFDMQAKLEAENRSSLIPECWKKKKTGTGDVFGRLWWDRPALTIRTEFFKPEKGRYLHPTAHRAITIREAARLQSFPDWFNFPDDQSMTAVARQIGNAVPPLFAQALAAAITCHLATHKCLPSATEPHREALLAAV